MKSKLKSFLLKSLLLFSLGTGSIISTNCANTPITLNEPQKKQIEFIDKISAFGEDEYGLIKSPHYREYKNTNREEIDIYYILNVTKPLILPDDEKHNHLLRNQKYRKNIEDYLTISSHKDQLVDEKWYYNMRGYDVYRRYTSNYDNGRHGSPVTEEFLSRTKAQQAQTILHENWHYSANKIIGRDFSSELNEAAAVLIGDLGTIEYFKKTEGELSKNYREARNNFENYLAYAYVINAAYLELNELYQNKNISVIQKFDQREKIFQDVEYYTSEHNVNNALLWERRPYTKYLPLVFNLYEHYGDLKTVTDLLKECPEDEAEGVQYIYNLIETKK